MLKNKTNFIIDGKELHTHAAQTYMGWTSVLHVQHNY